MQAVVKLIPSPGDEVEVIKGGKIFPAGSTFIVDRVYYEGNPKTDMVITTTGVTVKLDCIRLTKFKAFTEGLGCLAEAIEHFRKTPGMSLIVADLQEYFVDVEENIIRMMVPEVAASKEEDME